MPNASISLARRRSAQLAAQSIKAKPEAVVTPPHVLKARNNFAYFCLKFVHNGSKRKLKGLFGSALDPEKELPKSPWNTFASHSKYLGIGCLSKPSSDLKAATDDFVALCPRISVAKSPGKKEKQLKIIIENAKTVIKPRPILNKIVLKIGWIPLIFLLHMY